MITDEQHPTVSTIFNLLNDWRHLPFYSLETRSAPFFAVFMREILKAKFGNEIHEILIPEFPLRIGSLYDAEERNKLWSDGGPSEDQSYNVDYVAFEKGENRKTAYFVELKTDMGSRRDAQDRYLCDAREKTLRCFVAGIEKLARASNKKQKYVHLLHLLAAPGIELVSPPNDTRLYDKTFPHVVKGWSTAMDELNFDTLRFSDIRVVFIQPIKSETNEHGFEHIYFDQIASIVERRGDIGAMFANYLKQWTESAGSRVPRDIPFRT